jgi:hypothetical protein
VQDRKHTVSTADVLHCDLSTGIPETRQDPSIIKGAIYSDRKRPSSKNKRWSQVCQLPLPCLLQPRVILDSLEGFSQNFVLAVLLKIYRHIPGIPETRQNPSIIKSPTHSDRKRHSSKNKRWSQVRQLPLPCLLHPPVILDPLEGFSPNFVLAVLFKIYRHIPLFFF